MFEGLQLGANTKGRLKLRQRNQGKHSAALWDFPLSFGVLCYPARIRTRDVQQIAKPRVCLRFCKGLMDNFRELSNSPSGFGVRSLTYVVDEPDAFI